MFASLLGWMMAAGLAQASPGGDLLKALPADAEVVIHVRSVVGLRDDLLAMMKSMSPALSEQAAPLIEQGFAAMLERFDKSLSTAPMLLAVKLPKPGDDMSTAPMAFVLPGEDTAALIKAVAGPDGNPKPEPQPGGAVRFTDQDGVTIYFFQGDGWAAFSPKAEFIQQISARPARTLDTKLNDELKKSLFQGDIGVYVNLASLQTEYADAIQEARQQIEAAMEQAGGLQAEQVEAAKQMYATMFDALKQADGMAMHLDFDAAALNLSGLVTLKADSELGGKLKSSQLGSAEKLAKFPAGSFLYMYTNIDPKITQGLLRWNLSNMFGGNLDEQVAQRLLGEMEAAGRQETFGMMDMDQGMKATNVVVAEHPSKLAESMKDWMTASGSSALVKESKIESNVGEHRGFTLSKGTVVFDLEKMAGPEVGNPATLGMIKSMLGDGTATTFFGSDGKMVISLSAATLEEAKSRLDAVLDGTSAVGASAGFQAARDRLPRESSMLGLISAQGIVKMMNQSLSAFMGGEAMPLPADMPKEPAYLGGAVGLTPAGVTFDLVVPSAVGAVIEKGLGPIMGAMAGQINR